MFVKVLIEINALEDKTFTYSVPSNLTCKIKVGIRVIVPFGKKELNGIVTGIENEYNLEFELKSIIDVIDDEPILNAEMMHLGIFMSETYLCSLMSCYQSMIPSALKFNSKKINIKYETFIKKVGFLDKAFISEANILKLFKDNDLVNKKEIKNKNALKGLIEKGILKEEKIEKYRLISDIKKEPLKVLTEKQMSAFNYIKNSNKNVCLLRGVTGSGKTEIYIYLIKEYISKNKTCIVLVPEISLTTQLIHRFRCVFGDDIAILHSSLSDGERYDEFRRIKDGKIKVVIGTRSAVFAPLENLGLIIIDEEQEDTYKQENNPRYKTIDIAIERSKYNNAKVLLGSATPTLESYARSKVGKYDLCELTERVNKKTLPLVHIVDMKNEIKRGNSILSKEAIDLINDRISKNEQVMILINRRGYSNYIICNECGNVIKCPNCDISLTYHKKSDTLRCHYCGYGTNKPEACPKCKSKYLVLKGIGTEKIEELLYDKFKNIKVVRMDRDTTSNKGSHERIIEEFNNKEYNVLLGTQMIAKGLDFKDVTLVIVLNGDSTLNVPDYRSAEKTFELLTQVSGRAGRSIKEGIAIIQTYNPLHYSIVLSKNHDYVSFYNKEIKIRKQLNYPPFCFIVSIRLLTSDYELGLKEIGKVGDYLKNNLDDTYTVLGPSISLKINNIYKFQCIIKYKNKDMLYEVLKEVKKHYRTGKIKLEIDFNPIKI